MRITDESLNLECEKNVDIEKYFLQTNLFAARVNRDEGNEQNVKA